MRARLLREWLLVALLALALLALLVGQGLTARADDLLYDMLAHLRSPLPSRVTIVAIDEASLRALGRWPWPRTTHARLLAQVARAKPAAIGYDVLFVEPARDDALLTRAIAAAGTVVLPMTFSVPGEDGRAFALQLPTPPLAAVAPLGHAVLLPDRDGIVRRVSLFAGDAARPWPAFAERVYRQAAGTPSAASRRTTATELPGNGFGLSQPLLVPTTGGSHPTLPFARVLRGEVPPELLRGRILLVGSTAAGSGDVYAVPGGALPGVEVIADVIDALAADRIVRPVGRLGTAAYALLSLALILAGLLRLPPRTNLLLGLAIAPLVIAASAALLLLADMWLPPAAALAGLILVHPLWAWRRLAATSGYMTRELARLQAEPDLWPGVPRPAAPPTGALDDPIRRQTVLLEGAVMRVRDLRRFFAESLQALPDAVLIVDRDGHILVANRAAERLFGAADGAHLATLVPARFPAADLPRLAEDGEAELSTTDGRIFALRREPFTASDGRLVGAILRFTDLTTIRMATRQREEALRLLSHDMRAPQAAILALLDQPDLDRARDRLAGYARRTMRLADEFVLLARAEVAPLARETLNFAALLVEAADELWPMAQAATIRIETPDETEEHLVTGDRALLLRMLLNLIGNAVRYSPRATVVRCTLARDGGALCCRVADEGPGIPPDALEAIFQPFHRAGRSEDGGTGLGLAFVRAVVTRHEGLVGAANALGGGAVFTVRLPAAP